MLLSPWLRACINFAANDKFVSQLSESGSCSSFENVTQQDMEKRYSGSQRSMMSSNAANSKTRTNMAPDVDQSLMKKANAFVAKRKVFFFVRGAGGGGRGDIHLSCSSRRGHGRQE